MLQIFTASLVSLALLIGLPASLLQPPQLQKPEIISVYVEEKTEQTAPVVRVQTDTEMREIPVEEYLIGVVLAEMPASFHLEALKAQAVAARTFTYRSMEHGKHEGFDLCTDSSCCQAWLDKEQLQSKLGQVGISQIEKVARAVTQTAEEVLVYNGELIEAVYFSCSGGATEDAVAVWGSDVPYLRSVASEGEEHVSAYYSTVVIPIKEFVSLLQKEKEVVFQQDRKGWIGEITYTAGGGVDTVVIGSTSFSGNELREIFGLRSTNFQIRVLEDTVEFQVLGFGHRVGMSQYGADAMAQDGKSYREILLHYYTDVCIVKNRSLGT